MSNRNLRQKSQPLSASLSIREPTTSREGATPFVLEVKGPPWRGAVLEFLVALFLVAPVFIFHTPPPLHL